MATLDKAGLKSAIEAGFRNVEPGKDSVAALASAIANAVDAFVKSGTVTVNSTGGGCTYSGAHPPLTSTGSVS